MRLWRPPRRACGTQSVCVHCQSFWLTFLWCAGTFAVGFVAAGAGVQSGGISWRLPERLEPDKRANRTRRSSSNESNDTCKSLGWNTNLCRLQKLCNNMYKDSFFYFYAFYKDPATQFMLTFSTKKTVERFFRNTPFSTEKCGFSCLSLRYDNDK